MESLGQLATGWCRMMNHEISHLMLRFFLSMYLLVNVHNYGKIIIFFKWVYQHISPTNGHLNSYVSLYQRAITWVSEVWNPTLGSHRQPEAAWQSLHKRRGKRHGCHCSRLCSRIPREEVTKHDYTWNILKQKLTKRLGVALYQFILPIQWSWNDGILELFGKCSRLLEMGRPSKVMENARWTATWDTTSEPKVVENETRWYGAPPTEAIHPKKNQRPMSGLKHVAKNEARKHQKIILLSKMPPAFTG